MSKKLLAVVILVSVGIVVFGWMRAIHSAVPAEEGAADQQRLIVISDIASFKKLQEPPVVFNHGKHVTALEQEGCGQCHPYDEKDVERLIFQYPKDRKETSRRQLLNAYHGNCVGCHNERLKQGENAGPIACGECHTPDRPEDWIRPVTFDYGIHYKHEKAMEKKCETCHHIYDEEQKKLIYKEETESSCRDCHRDRDEENRREYRKVAHADCVNCHYVKGKEGKEAGPTACEKCHYELKVPTVKELADIPRPDRKQPKTTLIKAEGAGTKEVFFDHENHQMNTITCRTCHHESMNACETCHTLKGSADGAGITLEEAYHKKTSSWSCTGCHSDQKAAETCAGCHLLMRTDEMSKGVCVVCHTGPVESSPEAAILKGPEELISDNIDAEMKISALEEEYEPSKFPHLEIVKKLTKTSNDNKLSRQFHVKEVTMCQGCHHASAVEPKGALPKCGSCHKATLDSKDLSKPRLLAVYHLQCLGCHEKMHLKEQGCTDCHAEKKSKEPVIC
jgi:hypothetical protein